MKKVLTISGMSTSGKSTFADKLEETGLYEEVPSFTTRPSRPGEIDGKDYFFISKEEALETINSGNALQHVEINGNYYGSSKKDFDNVYEQGKIPMLVCDPNGPKALEENKELMNWKVLPIFLDAEPETLSDRILTRMQQEEEHIANLLEVSEEEANAYNQKYRKEYSIRIKNMSDLSDDQIENIFTDIKMVTNHKNLEDKEMGEKMLDSMKYSLSKNLCHPDSIEGKWKNDHEYFKVIKSEDIENDLDKVIQDLNCDVEKSDSKLKKEKNQGLNFS